MAKFLVAFDGKWQEKFGTLDEAVEWAEEVSATGRVTWVVERHLSGRDRLCATFPDERREDAEEAWDFAAGKRAGKRGRSWWTIPYSGG